MNNCDKPAMPVLEVGQQMHSGLTKREYLAGLAMQGLLANLASIRREGFRDSEIEVFAVMRADALLKELERGGQEQTDG